MRLPYLARLALTALVITSAHANSPDPAALAKIAALSVPFVPNAGQWNENAAFAAKTFAGTLFVTKEGQLVYSLPGKPVEQDVNPRSARPEQRTPGWVLSETLVDAKGHARPMSQSTLKAPAGYRPMEGKVSYGIGDDPSKHADSLNTYERVNLGDMYPGVNVQLRATGNNVEKIFTVAPHHDPEQIRIELSGANKLEISNHGELVAHTDNGAVTFTAPIAFQENANGQRTPIAVAYALNAAEQRYGFTFGPYDESRPLVVDPLLQSTYLGGTGADVARALAIHPATGDVYIAGHTFSANLPGVTVGSGGVATGAQSVKSSGQDAFVAHFNAALTSRLQSSYLGGSGVDQANALAIQPATGEVYVAGLTTSGQDVFPGVGGGAQTTYGGGSADAFVSRFSADLTRIIQSSYLGAAGLDYASAIAIHPATGDIYVAGNTSSLGTSFPGVDGGAQGSLSGGGFVSRLTSDLTRIMQSTYYGGGDADDILAIAVHPSSGDIYLAGSTVVYAVGGTTSTARSLPEVSNGAQSSYGGEGDGFVSRLTADLHTILRSTYLGAAGNDQANALAIHPATGDVYVAGYTNSPSATFPGVRGGAQSTFGGGLTDAFVARFSPDLSTLFRSSYLGAAADDDARALAIHPATGEVYVAGFTRSVGDGFPGVNGGMQGSSGGPQNSYVTRFNADLTKLVQSSFLGGPDGEMAWALAISPATGEVFLAGSAGSAFPGVSGGAQATYGGGGDAYVSRFSADMTALRTTPDRFAFSVQTGVPLASVRTSNPARISGIASTASVYVDGAFGSQYCISSGENCSCDLSSTFVSQLGTVADNNYVCVRHVSASVASQVSRTNLHVGGAVAAFISTTGTIFSGCNLDIDGSGGAPNAASDGLMLVRAMLGFTGDAVTDGAIFGSPPRNTWALIRDYLNQNCGTSFAP